MMLFIILEKRGYYLWIQKGWFDGLTVMKMIFSMLKVGDFSLKPSYKQCYLYIQVCWNPSRRLQTFSWLTLPPPPAPLTRYVTLELINLTWLLPFAYLQYDKGGHSWVNKPHMITSLSLSAVWQGRSLLS